MSDGKKLKALFEDLAERLSPNIADRSRAITEMILYGPGAARVERRPDRASMAVDKGHFDMPIDRPGKRGG